MISSFSRLSISISVSILSSSSSNDLGLGCKYTLLFNMGHKAKSQTVKSGDLGAQLCPLLPWISDPLARTLPTKTSSNIFTKLGLRWILAPSCCHIALSRVSPFKVFISGIHILLTCLWYCLKLKFPCSTFTPKICPLKVPAKTRS